MYQFRVKKSENKLIEKLDNVSNRNSYITNLLLEDLGLDLKENNKSVMETVNTEHIHLSGSNDKEGANSNSNSDIRIVPFIIDRLSDVVSFENNLRNEEDVWGWDIDDKYIEAVRDSFTNDSFNDCISLLAYMDEKVVGRIDVSMIKTRFDGSTRAYLDWICVLKSYRHRGVAQSLLKELCSVLKEKGISSLVGLTAANEEAQKFYQSIPNSTMRDIGIWIDIV